MTSRHAVNRFATWLTVCAVMLAGSLPAAAHTPAQTSAWTPDAAAVVAVESHVTLPGGSSPIADYQRFYAGAYRSGRKLVIAVYVFPFIDLGAGESPPGLPPGAHVVSLADLPRVSDGGCGVVVIYYDSATDQVVSIRCNPLA